MKVLIVWSVIPESVKIYKVEISEAEYNFLSSANKCYINNTDYTPALHALSVALTDSEPTMEDRRSCEEFDINPDVWYNRFAKCECETTNIKDCEYVIVSGFIL